ncbi:MAG: hypothetical protein K2J78_01825, partial [Muribaculaceae bacterium]|nr:hypothetical protein [Muribaculaceae bacterium]
MQFTDPDYDRLLLTPDRIRAIASDMRAVAKLPVPYGRVISKTVRPNGMSICKISVTSVSYTHKRPHET